MIGKQLGPYQILEVLGAGGMGEVYLAEDTRLQRKVAIKVLPTVFASDADRLLRFEQEARAAASLNHPHIAAIHDVGESTTDGEAPVRYMVQEYLQGRTLREVIEETALPLKKTLTLATEIAEALVAAHQAGIVHRDLKPENLFVTEAGHIKVLDFGLAKLMEPSGMQSGPSMSPTVTSGGQILGTAGYMSPEQIEGIEVDHRADIFAFGCIVYEMATRKRAFHGKNVHDTLNLILSSDPEPRSGLPLKLQWLFDKAMAKDRDMRYQSAADFLVDLKSLLANVDSGTELTGTAVAAAAAPPSAKRGPSWLVVTLGAAVVLLAGMALARWLLPAKPAGGASEVVRFDIVLPPEVGFSANYNRVLSLSPDGQHIVLNLDGQLWLRPLNQSELTPIPGTENARTPFISPDSREVCFWAEGQIKRTRFAGGVPATVAAFHERPFGASWATDGFLYIGRGDQGIWRIAEGGGQPEQVVSVQRGEFAHGPVLLPGGEWLLFGITRGVRNWRNGVIVAQSLKNDERRMLIDRGREVRYLSNGHLAYVQGTNLFVVPFDASTMQLTGTPKSLDAVVETAMLDETGAANFDGSNNGTLLYRKPQGSGLLELAWQSAEGKMDVLPIQPKAFVSVALSPDDQRVAAQVFDSDGSNIWIYDVGRGGGQRLTSTGENRSPVWSHDGIWVYFGSNSNGNFDIWRRRADRGGPPELFFASDGDQIPTAASADGRWLLISDEIPSNGNIRRVSLGEERVVEPLIETAADELSGEFSPDGRYFVFQSNESPQWDVQVKDTVTGSRWMLSQEDGGFRPRWSQDGSRIVYTNGDAFFKVEVLPGPDFAVSESQIFVRINQATGTEFDIDVDGTRVLLLRPHDPKGEDAATRTSVSVTLNWFAELAAPR